MLRAGGLGVIGNVSLDREGSRVVGKDEGEMRRSDVGSERAEGVGRARDGEAERDQDGERGREVFGRDKDAERHVEKLRKKEMWKRPFRSRVFKKFGEWGRKGVFCSRRSGSDYKDERGKEVVREIERFSIADGRISREIQPYEP